MAQHSGPQRIRRFLRALRLSAPGMARCARDVRAAAPALERLATMSAAVRRDGGAGR